MKFQEFGLIHFWAHMPEELWGNIQKKSLDPSFLKAHVYLGWNVTSVDGMKVKCQECFSSFPSSCSTAN